MHIRKFYEKVDFESPENKARMDIVNSRLFEINVRKEFESEIRFLKTIKKIIKIEFDPGDSRNIGWSIDDRIKQLEKYL